MTAEGPRWRAEHEIPTSFEVVLKINHPVEVNPQFAESTLTWDQIEKQSREDSPVPEPGSFDEIFADATSVRGVPAEDVEGRRVTWRTIADEIGVEFNGTFSDATVARACGGSWPRKWFGAEEGELPLREFAKIVGALVKMDPEQEVAISWDDIGVALKIAPDHAAISPVGKLVKALLRCGKGHERVLPSGIPDMSPGLMFATNRAWMFRTPYDCSFSLFAGPDELVAAVERVLEPGDLLRISRDAGLDWAAQRALVPDPPTWP